MDKQHCQNKIIMIEVIGQNEGICKTGVPFLQGQVKSLEHLKLYLNDSEIDCFVTPLCCWHDNSIKWLNISFIHSGSNLNCYKLEILDIPEQQKDAVPLVEFFSKQNDSTLIANVLEHQITIDLATLSLKATSPGSEKELFKLESLAGNLAINDSQHCAHKIEKWDCRTIHNLADKSTNAGELIIEGSFVYETNNKEPLRFKANIELFPHYSLIKVQISLHNPNRAIHHGEHWDLGDEGSVLFNNFMLNLQLPKNSTTSYQTTHDSEWTETSTLPIKIIQCASGGENWASPIHVDKNNTVPQKRNGFNISIDETKEDHASGRATPTVRNSEGIELTVDKFWQNFPSSIEIDNNQIKAGLFPSIPDVTHELQGGEKKTHTIWINLSSQTNNINCVHKPLYAKPDINWLIETSALYSLQKQVESDEIPRLILAGLESKHNFFAKREKIDEYGWRHFGDLYADHETAGYSDDEPFVSHYNNQYDPIYGFLKQFLLTGDARWFELADDLAKHIVDIDIYNTDCDKEDYNGGLFWHTDHYCKAHTATHRTYSKLQSSDAYQGRSGGGGPGAEHCYSTGLVYHHFLTGSEDSKQAVLTLSNWIEYLYEGQGTLIELLKAYRDRNVRGYKNLLNEQYPFDRGTGNYVNSLLDCYLLTNDPSYIKKIEHIIKNTIHPSDNIGERDLFNVESCWFYIVFLQATCRYLQVKESTEKLDDTFYYIRDALLHYADWMLLNEAPYLEKPEILEFPNDTWTAQDLRKAHVFAAASYYSPTRKTEYIEKAEYLKAYVASNLTKSEESTYTRILVLLMQNQGLMEFNVSSSNTKTFAMRKNNWPPAEYQKTTHTTIRTVKEITKRLASLSLKKEFNWLKKRIGA